ncbi:GR25 family glycosyltransferase involved in LPS biosynthesis [Geothermobacter ehrlichii]|uniref:GR25 family glycosyltransferase involved in LPS biosynthesis n=1 Tax=Geothermobacter ehrlichii TaxID=213224 RepID=A0A5D3WNA2_9BACT|nr:glycosyltransferase family 25 protein [Geothermobacter ehrlichii]TYP00052.1 GR25 family glycosyltransferase involved in LPS biosynthesis [Geothermobacter ehrlichii]
MTDNGCPIFIITLEDATSRQESIRRRLTELGLSFQFIPGVDGRKLDLLAHPAYEPVKRRLFYGRDLSNGEFGCVLGHRNVYRHMIEHRIECAVVLEDDSILTDELPAVLAALRHERDCWDLVRFLGRQKNYRSTRTIRPLPGTSAMLSRQLGIPGGAYGYMLNLRAAERLEKLMQKNWLAVDTLHGAVWLTGLRTFSVTPSPVLPNDQAPSCIDTLDDNLRWDKTVRLEGTMRLLYPLTRGLWKFYLNCCTQYVRFSTLAKDRKLARQARPQD